MLAYSLFAGNPSVAEKIDGDVLTTARFKNIMSIAIDKTRNIMYVNDDTTIRRICLTAATCNLGIFP